MPDRLCYEARESGLNRNVMHIEKIMPILHGKRKNIRRYERTMNSYIIISLAYYIGIASCAAQGAEKGKHDNIIPIWRYAVNSFGGGIIRDYVFLGVYPWVFTLSAVPDLAFAISIGACYTYYLYFLKISNGYHDIAPRVVSVTDALGAGSFIYKGMEQAFIYSDNIFTVIACGYVTTIAGGLLANGKLLMESLKSRKTAYYHIVILLGCCHYYLFRHSICLLVVTTLGLSLINANYDVFTNSVPCYKVYILYSGTYKNSQKKYQKIIMEGKRPQSYPEQVRIYILQHRIRQC